MNGNTRPDARETTAADARKWVLGPYETVIISGWQTSQTEARRFEFTTEARSYGQALGKTANLGVISAVFFKERLPRRSRAHPLAWCRHVQADFQEEEPVKRKGSAAVGSRLPPK